MYIAIHRHYLVVSLLFTVLSSAHIFTCIILCRGRYNDR